MQVIDLAKIVHDIVNEMMIADNQSNDQIVKLLSILKHQIQDDINDKTHRSLL